MMATAAAESFQSESVTGCKSVVYNSPLGPLKLTATEEGITAVKYLFGKKAEPTATEHQQTPEEDGLKWSERLGDDKSDAAGHLRVCCEWLDAYFAGKSLSPDPPPRPKLALSKKDGFYHTVWSVLSNTSVGETLSYKELATLSGSPKAYRAAGQAVKSHCIPILVPCHRVVNSGAGGGRGSKGGVGNYSGGDGTATKSWLLEHEKKMVDQEQCDT